MSAIKIKFYTEPMVPSKNQNPHIMFNQFQYRKTGEFIGGSEIAFALMEEPIWWNRPLPEDTTELVKLEPDGIYSYNFPLYIPKKAWKSDYNILLNKYNCPLAIHLKFDHTLTQEERTAISTLSHTVILKTLLDFGIQESAIGVMNNDLWLYGKKFSGGEQLFGDNTFSEDVLITFRYKDEKDVFDRLTYGTAEPKKQITGILDEFPDLCTQEQFIEKFFVNAKEYLRAKHIDFIEI